jgi:hypothetical protein
MLTMTHESDDAVEVLRALWSAQGQSSADLDELGEPKTCRNMRNFTFDAMADPGTDLREAWRDRLAREGKLNPSGKSVRDLVLGSDS